MFGWIADAWRRRRRNKSRNVFRFFDGQRTRAVDPYAVYRFLDQHPKFKWEHLDAMEEDDADAADTTIIAARQAFGLSDFDGSTGTLTAAEVISILTEFGEWLSAAKKKRAPGSISSPPTAGPSSSAQADRSETMNFSSAAT